MTITNQNLRTQYPGDDLEDEFAYNFRILSSGDLTVVLQDAAGVDTIQTLDSDYTVDGVGVEAGGNVTMTTAPATGETLSIILDPALTQLFDLIRAGTVPVESIEQALDLLTNIAKRTRDSVNRALKLFDGDTDGSGRFDANTNRIVDIGAPVDGTDAATLAYVQSQIAAAILDPTVTVTAEAADLLDETSYDTMLGIMGAGSKGLAILKDTTNAAVLTELGVTAYMQLLLLEASASDALDNLGVPSLIPNPNLLLNGDFHIWQNGEDFVGGTLNANDSYTADQWVLLSNGADIVDVSRIELSFPSGFGTPEGSSGILEALVTATGDNTKWGLFQPLEAKRSETLRSDTVTISLDIQSVGTMNDFRVHLVSYSGGTPDTILTDIIDDWEALETVPTPIAGVSIIEPTVSDAEEITGNSVFTTHSASFAVPANSLNLGVFICMNSAASATGDWIRISRVKLEFGAVATPFETNTLEKELADCERFFQKTFPLATAPASSAGVAGALHALGVGGGGLHNVAFPWVFRTRMRAAPTVATYNPSAAGAEARDLTNTTDCTATAVEGEGESGAFITATNAGAEGEVHGVHAAADARL